jgi:hypothetical protein
MHRAQDFGGAVGDRVAGTAREAPRKVMQARDRMMALIADQPLIAGAIGLAIGAVLAASLPKTEAEDELMGEASDAVKQAVGNVASDELETAKSAAANLASEVTRMAEQQGVSTESAAAAAREATGKLAEAVGLTGDDGDSGEKSGNNNSSDKSGAAGNDKQGDVKTT